jgi:hypothetical protein
MLCAKLVLFKTNTRPGGTRKRERRKMKMNELYNAVLVRLLKTIPCVNDTPATDRETKTYYDVDIIAWLTNKLTKSAAVEGADFVVYRGTKLDDGSVTSSVEARVRVGNKQYAGFCARVWQTGYQPYADRVSARPVGVAAPRATRREYAQETADIRAEEKTYGW